MASNLQSKRVRSENLAGQVTTTAWDGWSVTYNGENRPIHWQCQQSNNQTITNNQTISMSFDRMGRRVTKNNQRFIYNGYLQIANFEHQTSNIKLQTFIWDPTEPVATRPLVWGLHDGSASLNFEPSTLNFYTHDGNKNVSEVVVANCDVSEHYEYMPFGAVKAVSRNMAVSAQGFCSCNAFWYSSEYADYSLGMIYYNYRHYNDADGRWLARDPLLEAGGINLYVFLDNAPCGKLDIWGNASYMKGPSPDLRNGVAISAFVDYGYKLFDDPFHKFLYDFPIDIVRWLYSSGTEIVFRLPEDLFSSIDASITECDCISSFMLVAHGEADRVKHPERESDQVALELANNRMLYEYEDEYQITELFGHFKGKYCNRCEINVLSCYLGQSPWLDSRIRSVTGCNVKLYKWKVNSWLGNDWLSEVWNERVMPQPLTPPIAHPMFGFPLRGF